MEPGETACVVTEAESAGLNTIEYNITRFVQILRRLGVRVSLAETVDAVSALAGIDLLDKSRVRAALKACLAKSRREAGIFDQAYGLFFTTPEEKARRRQQYREARAERDRLINTAERELMEVVEEWQRDLPEKIVLTEQQLETFSLMPESGKERMKEILDRMKSNPVNNPGELINRVLQSSLNYWRYYMMKNAAGGGKAGTLPEEGSTGDEEMDEVIRSVDAHFYHHPGDRILHRDMESLDDSDIPRMTSLISHMSSQLALGISRRYKRSAGTAAVDIRRTVRRNIRYGGVPIELRYRARRRKRPRFLLICDVSASMARHARFVLQFIYGLNSALGGLESFIFSEDLERTTEFFSKNRNFARSMTDMINGSRQWGKSTNLHESLKTFLRHYGDKLTPDTVVFIVSDARTVAPEAAAGLLRDIKLKCADIIWLNTLPRREWEQKAPVKLFCGLADMYECSTLSQLEKALRRHVFKYA
ncbi:MAG: VWA domain-containing protein [Peptococcaceae bacterium]|nr:VWA domain-containing protein [Peptococcaceae bacterium]